MNYAIASKWFIYCLWVVPAPDDNIISPFYVLRIYVRIYWLWELVVFYSSVRWGYICKVSVNLVQKYFPHNCSTDSISYREQKKGIWWKQYQNETSNRQRQNSVTVSNQTAMTINTPLLLLIHRAYCQYTSASVVISNPLDNLSILRRRLRCHFFVFVLIFLYRRLWRCCIIVGAVV